MSEKLNSNFEQTIDSDSNGEAEFPPFDPAAAEQARQQRMAEYKKKYPDAVENVEKARFMARVEDPYRTQAITNRREASEHQDEADELYIKKEQLAATHDWEASTKVGDKWLHALSQSKIKKLEADKFDKQAEDAGAQAGDVYDSSRE